MAMCWSYAQDQTEVELFQVKMGTALGIIILEEEITQQSVLLQDY